MGLLDGVSLKNYYQGQDLGNYQFVSLDDVITQFQIMYVGEDKIISKASRTDVAFHAQRALAELSFDTFKSFKSQQIDLPPSLVMPMPHDYVNYTKISWVDNAGVKHPIYPTKHTSNPFQVNQDADKAYEFVSVNGPVITNGDFSAALEYGWSYTSGGTDSGKVSSTTSVVSEVLTFKHGQHQVGNQPMHAKGMAAWQLIDVSGLDSLNISADGVAASDVSGEYSSANLKIGLSVEPGDDNTNPFASGGNPASENFSDGSYIEGTVIEWAAGVTSTQEILDVDVSSYNQIYIVIKSKVTASSASPQTSTATNTIDNITVLNPHATFDLTAEEGFEVNSSTWNNYKANAPSENSIEDYRYEQHWLNPNERYGLEPSHAQINGSFYIDQRLGRIHFSSNISGKTVILDYISDSLGTDGEMQVPKLAEDAMYKHMLYDLVSTRSNIGGGRLNFHKKEKFAAVRKAKLRLSNIKLEELTQILRGQSKQIKH